MSSNAQIILASGSPRRRDLLASASITVDVQPSQIPEERRADEAPVDYALRMALEKCEAVAAAAHASGDRRPVLGADTIVVLDGQVLGKPTDRQDASTMISSLSGRAHEVVTAYCLRHGERQVLEAVTTEVRFRALSSTEIAHYLDGGEWRDKAGAYGIQGQAAHMAREVHGSYSNVVGLPLAQVVEALKRVEE